jgi:hypothetical protein
MRFFRLMAIGFVLLVLVGSILGTACAGAQGEPGPSMIVAMGHIDGEGNIVQGYNVTSATCTGTNGWWVIALTGINYSDVNYVTLVTPVIIDVNQYPAFASTMGSDGNLIVRIQNQAGGSAKAPFCFTVLEIP